MYVFGAMNTQGFVSVEVLKFSFVRSGHSLQWEFRALH